MILLQNIIDSKYHYQPSWVMIVIVLSVMILGYLFSAFNSRFIAVIKAFFSNRFTEQLSREEHSLSHPSSVFLSANFLVTSSLFILLAIFSQGNFAVLDFSFLSFLLVVGIVLGIYFIKILTLKILGFIFDKTIVVNEYIFIIYLVNQIIGIAFIPVIIFIAYGQHTLANAFVFIGVLLFIFSLIIRVGKGTITVFASGEVTPFYLFLYLCTFEILPLLLGWKLLEKLI